MTPEEFYANPMGHPRWAAELALEEEMLASGKDKAQERINKARERRDMGNLRPQRKLVLDWIEPVAQEIIKWREAQKAKRGVTHIARAKLGRIDPEVAAICALRVIVRMVGHEHRATVSLAAEIGTWLEHEGQAAAWRKVYPEGFEATVKKYTKLGANAIHQKRARVYLFNKFISKDIGWVDWTENEKLHVGMVLLDCVCKGTQRFTIGPDPQHKAKRGNKVRSRQIVLIPDGELTEALAGALDNELIVSPQFLPTVIPPKPWTGPRDGGYWTPFVKTPFLIRFKAMHEDQKRSAISEYNSLDMGEVYDAVNALQETPWRINKRVLAVANLLWDEDPGIKCMPKRGNEDPLYRSETQKAEHDMAWDLWGKMDEDEKEINKALIKPALDWARAASSLHKRNAKRSSKYISSLETLKAANRMDRMGAFYFPYMLDFRGRIYPIPSAISPQGNDLHKGLLTFAKGKTLDEDGASWLAVNVANAFGEDKRPLNDRVAWAMERTDLWLRIDEDPMEHREWLQADKGDSAWQALAAVLEFAGYLKDPDNFVSTLPIRVDGSCNGIQHLSAMVRDEVGGAAVNLLPGNAPRDIYKEVARRVQQLLEDRAMEGDPLAHLWLAIVGGEVPRSLTKRPVMILPYGGTRHAYFEYTMDWLDETDPECLAVPADDRYKVVGYMVRLLWKGVDGHLGASQAVMRWLKECCAIACASGAVLTWDVPSGFYVRQFYGVMEQKRISTLMDGQTYKLAYEEPTKTLDMDAQGAAIAPNFVHSQDASCLVKTVNKAFKGGVDCITTIHDSFGALAGDMWPLYRCIRDAFIENYQEDVLENFLAWCKKVNPKATNWPAMPPRGDLDLEEVSDSDYFFS